MAGAHNLGLLRRVLVVLAGGLALLALVAAGAFFAFSRPAPTGSHRPAAGLDPGTLDAHAGLYQDGRGRRLLLAPSARGGFALYRADDFRFRRSAVLARHVRRHGDGWISEHDDGQMPRAFRFLGGPNGGQGFEWRDEQGRTHVAGRLPEPPYLVRATAFASDVALSGTLFLPTGSARAPGAVLIHGSGTSDRDNLWYVLIARTLAEGGIAVLLPDKRGSGRSAGEWRLAGFDELAGDAVAGARVLTARPEVDPERVGVVGLSQGGWIAPLAARQMPALAFVVNTVGAVVTPRQQVRHEIRQQIREAGVPGWLAPAVLPIAARMPARRLPVFWRKNGDFDPLPLMRELPQPLLVVYGAEDERDNVPVRASVERLESLRADKPGLAVHVIDGVGHGLIDPHTEELHPRYRRLLVEWIRGVGALTPPAAPHPAPAGPPPRS